jgi:(p)ppGpp synthase/HD superfamily hydrolase
MSTGSKEATMTDAAEVKETELVEMLHRLGVWCDRVPAALALAQSVHGEQRRDGGGRYLEEHIYPVTVEVAKYLSSRDRADAPNAVLMALLHDTIEDSSIVTEQSIAERFGDSVSIGVATLTKPAKRGGRSSEATAEDEERYVARIVDSALPVRAIKVFDRLNNLAAVHHRPPDKRRKYLAETRTYYLDLACSVDDLLARQMADLLTAQEDRSGDRAAT